jgi:threonine dehydrogenase-like Zn-dependent dehydrogenase
MVYRGPYKVRVEEKDVPAIEHPNDAIVRVTLAAICGSDLHLYHGLMPDTRIGHTFGHEFIGVVEQVGSSVENLQVGDRVMVPFNISCGSCWFCARGLYSNCHNVNPNATPSAASTATRTPPAATTAARRSTSACRSPTSGRCGSPSGCTTRTPSC